MESMTVSKAVSLALAAFLLDFACGGAMSSPAGTDGGAPMSTATTGGGGQTAASSGAGGTGTGAVGSGPTGTGTGGTPVGTGAGGSAAALDPKCLLEPQSGNCRGYIPVYAHDPKTGVCKPFIYGGCGGNVNRFQSLEECQDTCSGGQPDLDDCSATGQCSLVPAGCCSCEGSKRHFVAVSGDQFDAYNRSLRCELVDCAPCAAPANTQTITTTCRKGRCEVIDLKDPSYGNCQSSADCVLRAGARCCESCGGDEVIAVRRDVNVRALVCGPMGAACPPCVPVIRRDVKAECIAGSCVATHTLR